MDPRSIAHHFEDDKYLARARKLYTLVFPTNASHNKVLLGMKLRGFGKDKYNGFGGKVEPNETVKEGAVRELHEEAGVLASRIELCGILFFYFESDPVTMEVHVFRTAEFTGVPEQSDEMRPQWFDINKVPFERMWADDSQWWPYLLNNKQFCGRFWFKDDMATITKCQLHETNELDP